MVSRIKRGRCGPLFFLHNQYKMINRWEKGSGFYSVNGISIAGSLSQETIEERRLVRITDILGREISHEFNNTTVIYIYSDGTIKKRHLLK